MSKSPLATVKARFGEDKKAAKAKLVEAVRAAAGDLWVEKHAEGGLSLVSNAKLLHLENAFKAIKAEVGSRSGLVDGVLKLEKREKDAGYRTRLESQTSMRLWDRYRSLKRAAKAAG